VDTVAAAVGRVVSVEGPAVVKVDLAVGLAAARAALAVAPAVGRVDLG